MTVRAWTCRKCKTRNLSRARKCVCGKPKPPKRKPKHTLALELSYERYAVINGGEHCGICGATAKTRRLHRDHEHKGDGLARGLLCFRCNTALPNRVDAAWLRAAADYLDRALAREQKEAA